MYNVPVLLGSGPLGMPSSKGVANEDEFNAAAHIKKKGVNILAKKAFVKKMSDVPVERVP